MNRAPCLVCDGEGCVVLDIGGGDTEECACICGGTGYGPAWFATDEDEQSAWYRWDEVEYDFAGQRYMAGDEEVEPMDCLQCGRDLVETTGVPLCARCDGTMRAHARMEQSRIEEVGR
jgi:hypothetical protein